MSLVRFAATVAASAALLVPLSGFAQPKAQQKDQPLTAQQQRMKSCNAEAGDKHMKGEERQAFMSHCLKGAGAASGRTAQQEKMVACNRSAGERKLKGEERKSFMSECLSAKKGGSASAAGGR